MLLAEHARQLDAPPAIQVFATDLDEDAIRAAREGDLSRRRSRPTSREERLRRFFMREPRGYRVRREMREMVLFATHDLLKDAPFSRLDLIVCRNLLHLPQPRGAAARARDRSISRSARTAGCFSALGDGGRRAAHLFRPVDKKHRIYRAAGRARASPAVPIGRRRHAGARARPAASATSGRDRARAGVRARPSRSGRAAERSGSARGASCT